VVCCLGILVASRWLASGDKAKFVDTVLNFQHPTLNIQNRTPALGGLPALGKQEISMNLNYDLEDRLLNYSARIIRLVEKLPNTRAGNHVAGQLLRSGTSPLPNHGEAQAAESANDFVHKLKVCLKELRESYRWLRLVQTVPLLPQNRVTSLVNETDELIRIFVTSIRTAGRRKKAA
jgi:four helix bundle protein